MKRYGEGEWDGNPPVFNGEITGRREEHIPQSRRHGPLILAA